MFEWLKRRSPPDDPIPAEVAKVTKQTEELRRLIAELKRAQKRAT